ncbi:MAG: undecaprenyl-diphosphate phosphatase [Clostridia bacterium]|nr:undecaprenyl-diphosphate phosphatase [Clostridia bacterium]
MTIIQSIILGIVQGLTEFLPVSSSAHLNLFPWVFNWQTMPDSFDVALHIGTLLAIVIFFFKDWINLIIGGYKQVVKKEKSTEGRIFWYLVIATIPAGILSLVLDKLSGKLFENNLNLEMLAIAIALIVMGIVLYVVDKKAKSNTNYENMSLKQTVLIGISQALAAAFPGVSRSGITMTVARSLGVDRESAAKFSFLLATPITFAAAIFDLDAFVFDASFFAGVISSFIVGIFIIKFLLDYLKKGSFKVFAIYRVIIGIIVIGLFCIR